MKQELKIEDIVGYLPYELEIQYKMYKYRLFNRSEVLNFENIKNAFGNNTHSIIPKLIPVHSLTKEQLVHFSICFRLWYDKPNFDYKLMIYQDIETCHKLHVDYRGLIEKGLAIKK